MSLADALLAELAEEVKTTRRDVAAAWCRGAADHQSPGASPRQLSVYLRMIDVPVPSIYGPSADERTF